MYLHKKFKRPKDRKLYQLPVQIYTMCEAQIQSGHADSELCSASVPNLLFWGARAGFLLQSFAELRLRSATGKRIYAAIPGAELL